MMVSTTTDGKKARSGPLDPQQAILELTSAMATQSRALGMLGMAFARHQMELRHLRRGEAKEAERVESEMFASLQGFTEQMQELTAKLESMVYEDG